MTNWKNWVMFKPISDFYHMFFTNDIGMSLRKWGFVFTLFAAYHMQLSVLDDHIKQNIISSWMIFGAVCLGMVTAPQIIDLLTKSKDGATPDKSPDKAPDGAKQD